MSRYAVCLDVVAYIFFIAQDIIASLKNSTRFLCPLKVESCKVRLPNPNSINRSLQGVSFSVDSSEFKIHRRVQMVRFYHGVRLSQVEKQKQYSLYERVALFMSGATTCLGITSRPEPATNWFQNFVFRFL